MYIKREFDWNDLKENSWAGAVQVLEEVEKQGREDEAMSLIAEVFCDEIPDETQVNDYICDYLWVDLEDDMNLYGDEEEEDED